MQKTNVWSGEVRNRSILNGRRTACVSYHFTPFSSPKGGITPGSCLARVYSSQLGGILRRRQLCLAPLACAPSLSCATATLTSRHSRVPLALGKSVCVLENPKGHEREEDITQNGVLLLRTTGHPKRLLPTWVFCVSNSPVFATKSNENSLFWPRVQSSQNFSAIETRNVRQSLAQNPNLAHSTLTIPESEDLSSVHLTKWVGAHFLPQSGQKFACLKWHI